MLLRRLFVWTLPVAMMVFGNGMAFSQNYPDKLVRIVTSVAGGGNDFLARLVAQQLTSSLGQQVIVENRGVVAADVVAKAPPDGYTLIAYGSPLWLTPFLRDEVRYDPVNDFSPISSVARTPGMIVVHPSLPVRSVKELIVFARARPGQLNFGAGAIGATPFLSGELFKAMAKVNIVSVPYKGAGPAVNALVAGHVEIMFPTANTVMHHLKEGRLRGLAVSSAEPSPLAPGLPTVSASGLPGFEAEAVVGIFAPAKTPREIINRLNKEIALALNKADVKERLLRSGSEGVSSSPEHMGAIVTSEMAKWGALIKKLRISEK